MDPDPFISQALDLVATHITPKRLLHMEEALSLIERSYIYKRIANDFTRFKLELDDLASKVKCTNCDLWLKSLIFANTTNSAEIVFTATAAFIYAQRHGLYHIANDEHRAAVTLIHLETLMEQIKNEKPQ